MITAASIGLIAQAGAGATFSYNDIPSQLFRINGLEGSFTNSGAVLTGVSDVSGTGQTITVTGSPVYTATNTLLNNSPSFRLPGGASHVVQVPNINRQQINWMAVVLGYNTGDYKYTHDGLDSSDRHYIRTLSNAFGGTQFSGGGPLVTPYPGTQGRRVRALMPFTTAQAGIINGASSGTGSTYGGASVNGIVFGNTRTTCLRLLSSFQLYVTCFEILNYLLSGRLPL